MESPSPVDSQPSQSLPSISRPPSVDSTQDENPARSFQPPGRPPARPLLSPRSPSLHGRGQILRVPGPPTGSIDAHQSPFLSANTRSYAAEPMTSQPGLPTPAMGPRTSYYPAGQPTAPTPPPNIVRQEIRRPSQNFPQSGAASPMASYSPYSQPASVASSQFESGSQQGSYMGGPRHSQSREFSNPPIAMETERSLIPMQPSSQSTIQMMTIKSQGGHHVQIPVDVQAASKVADEKRRRNAGASARFRARRKEKEKEASNSISRLEQQLRDAMEDLEYYRGERDHFKSIVFQQPGAENHYARPSSPRLRRRSVASLAPSSTGGGSVDSYSTYDEGENTQEPDRNVRRRTSSYHPASGLHMNNGPPPPLSYSAPAFASVNQQFDPREERPTGELQAPPSQAPILRDPFAADVARYQARNWGPGPTQESRG